MSKEGFWRKAFAVVGVFLAASSLCAQPAPEPATEVVPKQLVTSQHFMVVAAHPLAARAGYDAIRRGGTAGDAAIATELGLGLVQPAPPLRRDPRGGGGGRRGDCNRARARPGRAAILRARRRRIPAALHRA